MIFIFSGFANTHEANARISTMKFVLAIYGTRGDVEPSVAVGRELLHRGHDVRMAVPPDQIDFVESAGLPAVAYGLAIRPWLEMRRDLSTSSSRSRWRRREMIRLPRKQWEFAIQCWREMNTTLTPLVNGADLLITCTNFEGAALNVADYYDVPLAVLHYFPLRANGHFIPILPARLGRSAMTVFDWLNWRGTKRLENTQRRELGVPKATSPAPRRIAKRGSLEIQAYDEICFPGLAAEWSQFNGRRPFVGALTLELPTDADDEVASWIAEGPPPILFSFGSMRLESPVDTLAMISVACGQLGERALVCGGWSDFSDIPHMSHVKVVGTVNYAAILPMCRAIVHHGGSGTLAAGLRAGVPQLILWMDHLQAILGTRIKRLKLGKSRRFSSVTRESLVSDVRTILNPQYVTRAREFATRMSKSAESAAAAADLVEDFARGGVAADRDGPPGDRR
jgi:UDP:flavonoid glycosyltransferase YjiC (YdhE family)